MAGLEVKLMVDSEGLAELEVEAWVEEAWVEAWVEEVLVEEA